jgi:GR25 family glycosyltransferase involved in LPS biosynthesis
MKKSFSKKVSRSRSAKKWLKQKKDVCDRKGECYNNFNKKMGVYVINCKMHRERYNKFKKFARAAKVKACRIPCVLGKKFSDQDLCDMVEDNVLSYTYMTRVEVSINMSHYNAWQKLINSCNKYAIILEDDIELKPDFVERVNRIMKEVEKKGIDFSLFHLWNGNWAGTAKHRKNVMKIDDLTVQQETREYNAGAAAYIISKSYAKWLHNHFFPIDMPQDILMGSFVKHGKHLTLKMKWDRKEYCYKSPLLDMPCGGEGGTGGQTTQTYNAPTVDEFLVCEDDKERIESNKYRYDGQIKA